MGAQAFEETILAPTAKEGFDILYNEAIYQFGREAYNGTISTCSMARRPFYTFKDSYKESNYKKAMKMIEDDDYGEKWIAKYIDLGVVEYRLMKPKKINTEKEKPKYKLSYVVKENDYMSSKNTTIHNKLSFDTKSEAVSKAMQLASNNNKTYCINREYVIEKGNPEVARIEIEEKSYKSKPKNIPKGCAIKEIHKYIFFGWASC